MLIAPAVKLGVFSRLAAGPRTAEELAGDLGLDRRAALIFLEALADAGYLERADRSFRLAEAAKDRFGDKSSPNYLGWAVLHSWRLAQRWLTLPEVLLTGEPVPGDRFSETVEGFIRAMDVYASPTAEEAVAACLKAKPGAASVLDIGGATGTVSKVFARHGLAVTLFDIPDVIETINDEMAAVLPTVALAGGDFNEAIPPGPFDIVFLGNVTHIYGPEKNLALYKRVYASLAPGGLIAIQDYVRQMSSSAAFFGINMLVNTAEGGTWTETDYTDELAAAGFGPARFISLATRDQQLILADK